VVAYLRAKKNIDKFIGINVFNNKIYQINNFIINRKNKSERFKYVPVKDRESTYLYKGEVKGKHNISVEKTKKYTLKRKRPK
jgi:hypothetical protein